MVFPGRSDVESEAAHGFPKSLDSPQRESMGGRENLLSG